MTLPELDLAADAAGLLDVAYATLDSPAGRLLLAATPRGVVTLAYVDDDTQLDHALERLANTVSPRILAAPRRLDEPRRELDQFFAGDRRRFDVPLDWQLTRGFGRRVLEATARIPFKCPLPDSTGLPVRASQTWITPDLPANTRRVVEGMNSMNRI